ncbi:sulfotransferase family cytosolic 1B member 1-like [Sitophilus oryzae]|uniref:Sulfotransferase family cytosolic 1B member 1-like n=1 Tax=Sitophilus oryzae TaxID=7048 RepID=A0A6J2XFA2_SITOR|nr:sulfotransferase family cytosolic 1B member 1-like [Sitophilus oryzae]
MVTIPKECLHEMDDILGKWSCEIGGTYMPKTYLTIQNKINNWKVSNEDVWIISFPKTGTTWTQEMVWLILNDLNYKGARKNLLKRSPQIEATALVRYPHIKFFKPFIPQAITDSLKYVKNLKHPACIKSHLPWNLLPEAIQKDVQRPKIIYISRNPKDTCVSYYYFSKLIKDFDGTLDEFCNLFLRGKINYAPYWDHVLPFWKRRNEENILFLKYEELKQDLPGVIDRVAIFLGKNLSQEQIYTLADHLSFDNMKNNTAVNYDWLVKLSSKYKADKNSSFMRTGKVGDYKNVMSEEMIERFDKWTKEHTKGTGLDF